jgi:hypothetical protein
LFHPWPRAVCHAENHAAPDGSSPSGSAGLDFPAHRQCSRKIDSLTMTLTNTKHSLNATSLTYEIFPDPFQLE